MSLSRIIKRLDPKIALFSGLMVLSKLPTANAETNNNQGMVIAPILTSVTISLCILYCCCCMGRNREPIQPTTVVLTEGLPPIEVSAVVIHTEPQTPATNNFMR